MAADRFVLKQFAGSATNNGAFGAAQATGAGVQPVSDIKDVQSLNAFEQGWNAATLTSDKLPALEEMQGLEALLCKALKENYSEGIPFWIAGETYFQYSFVNYNGVLYYNTTGSYTNNNPAIDTVNWAQYKPATAGAADTAAVADKLGVTTVGSETQGIYLNNGVPTPMTTVFANQDLSNLTATGENHFANPALTNSPYTTSRILEIPQDIKLELNNGTLTLKAGSRVYVPNGFEADGVTPKFDEYITSNDIIDTDFGNGSREVAFLITKSEYAHFSAWPNTLVVSGTSAPDFSASGYWGVWYDTANNIIKTQAGSNEWITYQGFSLPLSLVSSSSSAVTSIDQVFNGFGYIGSTVFALPGVKVQIPNGRNADGTYRVIPYTTQNVITKEVTGTGVKDILIYSNGVLSWADGGVYLAEDGYVRNKTNSAIRYGAVLGQVLVTSAGKIDSFVPRNVDSVANSNASNFSQAGRSYLSGLGMPSSRYIDLTLGASDSTYTAPANGWFSLSISTGITYLDFYSNIGLGINGVNLNNNFTRRYLPVHKGDVLIVYYIGTPTVDSFRFIYAEGEK